MCDNRTTKYEYVNIHFICDVYKAEGNAYVQFFCSLKRKLKTRSGHRGDM